MDYERDENAEKSTTFEVIRLTLRIYGSAFLAAFCVYTIVRPRYPLAYNFCNSVREYNNHLARNHFGHLKWIWKIFRHSDEEIFESCGITALVLLRFLRMGMKIAAVGIFNSFYLIPVNLYGCSDEFDECNNIADRVERIGMGNLSQGSLRLVATTFAAYTIFGSTMYFIYNEFEWFTAVRHKFLSRPRVDNYSVYVAHIPKQYRGDVALLHYFKSVFEPKDVLEAKVALDLYALERKVAYRERLVQKLEHAINKRELNSVEPTHLTSKGEVVYSIPSYTNELQKLNTRISDVIKKIDDAKEDERKRFMLKMKESSSNFEPNALNFESSLHSVPPLYDLNEEIDGSFQENKTLPTNVTHEGSLIKQISKNSNLGLDHNISDKAVEVVITPTAEQNQHFRDISELPTDISEGKNTDKNYLSQTDIEQLINEEEVKELLDKKNSDLMHPIPEILSNNSGLELNDSLKIYEKEELDTPTIKAYNVNKYIDLKDKTVEAFDLSDLQSDPFCQLFFSDITPRHDMLEVGKESSNNSLVSENDGSSVFVAKEPDVDERPDTGPSGTTTSDEDDASSVYIPKNNSNEPEVPRRSLFPINSDEEPSSVYVLDEEANKDFIADLRNHLRKGRSSRSLLSLNSQGSDVPIIVNSATIPQDLKNDSNGPNSPPSIAFSSFEQSNSSFFSRRTKDVLPTSILKTADDIKNGVKKSVFVVQHGMKKTVYVVQDGTKKSALVVQDKVKKTVTGMKQVGVKSVRLATNLLRGSEDGKVRDGGFVTFTTLTAKAQCVQMLHHESPFQFRVTDAPMPKDVFWDNVGLTHKKQQIGFLVAQLLTAGLCLFWTIPVAFISSFSEVESLKKSLPTLEKFINENAWLQPMLAQLSPILLVILKMFLPNLLHKFCEREGHISRTKLNASLMTKLTIFMIVQIFFVPAISGSIFAQLPEIIDNWKKIMELLATSVPGQVKSFIQYVLVNVFLSSGLELTRVVRVFLSFMRSFIGPNLSEKERNTTFMWLTPLTEPEEMDFPLAFAEIVLYCMILLVYSCIAPIMSYVMLFAFFLLMLTYRNQFIYIYSEKFDQGGMLWSKMMKMTLLSMLIAQITLIGIMTIKNSALSSSLLVPLCWITILFALYLEQEHYKVADHLPSTICRRIDLQNRGRFHTSFLKEQYLQPALKRKILLPETDKSDEEKDYFSIDEEE